MLERENLQGFIKIIIPRSFLTITTLVNNFNFNFKTKTAKASRAVSTKSNQSSCAFYLHSKYSNIFSLLDIKFGTEQADVFTLYGALHAYTCILLSFFSLILVISRNVLWNLSFNSKLCRSVSNRRYILENGCKKNEL